MTRSRKSEEPPVYNRLAAFRERDGLSRADLATSLAVHYQTVGYLERGEYKPSLVIALRAAALFGVPVEAIFSFHPFADAPLPDATREMERPETPRSDTMKDA